MKPFEKIEQSQKLLREARVELGEILKTERSRRRGEALRQIHNISVMLGESRMFYSQAGQDRVIDQLLGGKARGTFVDVGGYDGVTGSNTLFFEIFRKWSGILIEPAPKQLALAKAARRCPCYGDAIAAYDGTAEFMEVTAGYTQMSGFLASYDPTMLDKIRANPVHTEIIHQLKSKRLSTVLEENKLQKIDYISLDVEGGEMDILAEFPFDDFDVSLWSIENNSQSSDLPKLMKSKGYNLVEFAGVDDIFQKAT